MFKRSEKNTPRFWDAVWQEPVSKEEDAFNLVKEENSIRWQRIENTTLNFLGTFKGLRVIVF